MRNGQRVIDVYTGELGTIANAGDSWVDVQWTDEYEENVATHRLKPYNEFDKYIPKGVR